MPDSPEKPDPFKPAMPSIPGVGGPPAPPPGRNLWLAIVILACLALAGVAGWKLLRKPQTPAASPEPSVPEATAPAASSPAAPSSGSVKENPDGSVDVASVEDLAKPWSAQRFHFRNRLTGASVPAMVVRLPAGAPGDSASYWAFSLQAPFGRCELDYATDLAKLSSEYGYQANHPMVVDACKGTVYDPLTLGNVGGAWVRGEIVQGPGIRPPLSIEVRVERGRVIAARME